MAPYFAYLCTWRVGKRPDLRFFFVTTKVVTVSKYSFGNFVCSDSFAITFRDALQSAAVNEGEER